jgi:hypothetical protein
MPTKPIELEFQDKADLLDEISVLEAAALRRDETAVASYSRRDGWWYAKVEFVEAAQ